MTPANQEKLTRRAVLRGGLCGAAALGLGSLTAALARRARAAGSVWQIDPDKCVRCGNCATYCVLQPSAVKCVHSFDLCGRCRICFGYFDPKAGQYDSGAENQLCPTGAIARGRIEKEFYDYRIDERLCIGCGKCVQGCTTFGNGSLYLQIRHDRCVQCNQCAIAAACPAGAISRVPADRPYLLKTRDRP